MNEFFKDVENITALTTTTKSGIVKNYVEIPVEVKGEDGNKHLVFRKLYNEVAVSTIVNLEQLSYIRTKSLKAIVLSFGKITNKMAESVGLKSAKALIKAKFPEYSDNTISKYRRIALLFSNSTSDPNDFTYCDLIPQDTPISNLDAILTLFGELDAEKASAEEIEKAISEIHEKYILTDELHLLASQQTLKKEVHEILHPSITVQGKVVEEGDDDTDSEDNTNSEDKNAEDNTNSEDNTSAENEEIVNRAFAILKIKISGNKKAEKLFTEFLKELEKIE